MDADRRRRFIAYFTGKPFKGDRSRLIDKTGYTKGRIAQFFDEDQAFGERAARSLAGRLNLPLDFFERDQPSADALLLDPRSPGEPSVSDNSGMSDTFVPAGFTRGTPTGLQVRSTIRVATGGNYTEERHDPHEGTVAAYHAQPGAYAVKVRGDSLAPAIRDGHFLIVEPGSPPVVGEDVLIELNDGTKLCHQLLFERHDTITSMSVTGGPSLTTLRSDIARVLTIAGVCPPSKWRPS